MSIQKGDPIPNARLFALDESGTPRATLASELFAGKRVVLFAVPGAPSHAPALKSICLALCKTPTPSRPRESMKSCAWR
jgi:peroxiredoxin